LIGISILLLQSCGISKHIPENQSLLRANNLVIKGVEKDLINDFFYKDDLLAIPVQKPNKRILNFWPLSLNIWAFYSNKKVTKFTQFMKTKVGAEPVLFDSSKLFQSINRFQNYYSNIGHFNNKVEAKITTQNKVTTIDFIVEPQKVFTYRNIYFDSTSTIEKIIFKTQENSFISKGESFNIENLKLERQRITDVLNNKGYYFFNKEFILFKIDTFQQTNQLDIYIKIQKETDTSDFKKYKLDSIYVLILENENDKISNENIKKIANITFIQPQKSLYNEKFMTSFFELNKDSFYSKENANRTLQRLTDLNNFKLINSNFSINPNKANHINALYSLSPFKKQFFSTGFYAYNSSQGLLGNSLSLIYNNRNLTKRADRLNIAVSGGLELNFSLDESALNNNQGFISRSDISLTTNYTIEKLMIPFRINKEKLFIYKTNFFSKYTYEKRINYYDLHNMTLSFGYEWSKNPKIRHFYNPLALSYIYLPPESVQEAFANILLQNPYLRASFDDALILGSNYQFSYFNTSKNKKNNFGYKFNAETAGNFPYLAHQIFSKEKDNIVNFNDVIVSQYVKFLSEMVYSHKFNKQTAIHTRLKMGAAFSYGNFDYLPYIKQFFLGGPYSIRAFPLRQIGPGSFDVTKQSIKDQTGNLLLEGNLEYRFNIIKMFKGALFTDMGNIWLTKNEFNTDDQKNFQIGEFYKQFYIGGGFGLRFDFDYFAIRMDLGFPIRVPYKDGAESWVIKEAKPFNPDWQRQNLVFNIAVGYPF
jgi:outer membrane protein assembly factor BamA